MDALWIHGMCDPSSCFRLIFRLFTSFFESTESIPLVSFFSKLQKQRALMRSRRDQTDGDMETIRSGIQSLEPAGIPVSNIGVGCERSMERTLSTASDIVVRPWDGVPNQEPHYFTFEVSWEVANKGKSHVCLLHIHFCKAAGMLIASHPLLCLTWSRSKVNK